MIVWSRTTEKIRGFLSAKCLKVSLDVHGFPSNKIQFQNFLADTHSQIPYIFFLLCYFLPFFFLIFFFYSIDPHFPVSFRQGIQNELGQLSPKNLLKNSCGTRQKCDLAAKLFSFDPREKWETYQEGGTITFSPSTLKAYLKKCPFWPNT